MFSNQIKKLRKEKKIKQKEIAAAIGVSTSTYAGYESGYRKPDIEKLTAIADVLEVSLDELLMRHYPGKEFLEKYDTLDAHDKQIIDYILNMKQSPQITPHYTDVRMASRSENSDKPVRTEQMTLEEIQKIETLEDADENL